MLGVLADDKTNTLWVCQNATGGRGGAPVAGQTALRSFDLKSGAAKGTYPFPPNSGVCNDIAVSADGTRVRVRIVSRPRAPTEARRYRARGVGHRSAT